jgi:hypothetical protein
VSVELQIVPIADQMVFPAFHARAVLVAVVTRSLAAMEDSTSKRKAPATALAPAAISAVS